MKEAVKKEILYDLQKTIQILKVKEHKDVSELQTLSNHGIEDVALHKDLDLVSITVLIYSLYKVAHCFSEQDYKEVLRSLERAQASLKQGNLGKYNKSIKDLFRLVRKCNASVKEHLDDVMHAAQIKKGTLLLEKGLSMGQAAGLMGLSNWDLQEYVGKTPLLESDHEAVKVAKRLLNAQKLFQQKATANSNNVLFFDAGPIITLVMSRLAFILPELKKIFNGKFYITPSVQYELVQRPLTTKRFEFEALEVMKMIKEGTLEVYGNIPTKQVQSFKKLANSAFSMGKKTLDILQEGEMESITSALQHNASIVMDERTLRLLIESNQDMKSLLEHRNKSKVTTNKEKMDQFSKQFSSIPIVRSIELAAVAIQKGLLQNYLPPLKHGEEILHDAVLWATKFNGCAVSEHEIEELKQILLKE